VAQGRDFRDLSIFRYVSLGADAATVSARRRAAAGTGTCGTTRTGFACSSASARAGGC